MKEKMRWILALILILVLVVASPALAQDPDPEGPTDDEVNAIAKNMYCPVCENTPLDQCGTLACAQWREEIRDKLAQGWTEEEIYDYFALKFGDRVLAEPPRRGLNWLVYILPPALFAVGAFVLFRGFQSWRKPVEALADSSETPLGEAGDEYISRLEEELKNRGG